MQPKIGYIPIRYFNTTKPKVCEAPRHKGMGLIAFGVLAIKSDDYPDGLVQMVCVDCWNEFDRDLGQPQWSLIPEENNGK